MNLKYNPAADSWEPLDAADEAALRLVFRDGGGIIGVDLGHLYVRNADGNYDRWRGAGHEPGGPRVCQHGRCDGTGTILLEGDHDAGPVEAPCSCVTEPEI